ncbi:MAG: tetratricopeptide repeat protein [Candidatus Aminicenantes bacterium]|nr:tetratricopeptide repeat protein [Candidatus Aminicenantes bacterium]
MLKKTAALFLALALSGACATWQAPLPTFHVDNLPPGSVTALTLEERIILEEAWSRIRRGDAKGAEKLFFRLGADNSFYEAGLGYVALLREQDQAAETLLLESLNVYPEMTVSRIGLAQLYQKTGRIDAAFNEYLEVLKIDPENAWALRESEAIRERQTEILLREGVAHFEQGSIEESKEAFNKALHYSPKSLEAHLNLGRLYMKENQPNNALVHLDAAAAAAPKNQEILREYAEALLQAGQFGRSLEVFEKLLDLDPKNKDILAQAEKLKNRLGIFELPSQYDLIPAAAAVTREDMAALIAVKLKDFLEDPGTRPPVIIDIATSWASRLILKVASLGLMEVYPNHTFEPKRILSRAETAEMVMNLVNHLKRRGGRPFIRQFPPEMIRISDVSTENIHYQSIVEVVSLQLMDLDPEKSFRPDQPVSGRDAVRILDLILALLN